MSVWTSLFGGTSTEQHKGASPYINAISDWANGISTKIGKSGKVARQGLTDLASGDYDSNANLSGYFAPIRDMYATSVREGERSAAMGVGAKFGQDNPVLAQRISQLNEERARESEGQAMTRMVPQLYESFSNTYQNALQGQRGAEAMKGSGLQAALQAYLSQFYQKSHTGLIPALSGLAQGAGSMAYGFGMGKAPAPSH